MNRIETFPLTNIEINAIMKITNSCYAVRQQSDLRMQGHSLHRIMLVALFLSLLCMPFLFNLFLCKKIYHNLHTLITVHWVWGKGQVYTSYIIAI